MVGEVTNDEGYYSVLDFTNRNRAEVSQHSDNKRDDIKRDDIKRISAEHLRAIEEKLKELKQDNLKYCHEIEASRLRRKRWKS